MCQLSDLSVHQPSEGLMPPVSINAEVRMALKKVKDKWEVKDGHWSGLESSRALADQEEINFKSIP